MDKKKKIKSKLSAPCFNAKMPRYAHRFFDSYSDEDYKRTHPFAYSVLISAGIAAFLLPMILYTLTVAFLFSDAAVRLSAWNLLGMVGALIIGIGLFNIVAAWIHQYLGHLVTLLCFLIGGLFVSISLTILYVPEIYALFNEQVTTFYFVSIFLDLLFLIFYIDFRFSINYHLMRQKRRKRDLAKKKKGFRNFWWYELIHEEGDLRVLYPLNKLFTLLFVCFLAIEVPLGWTKLFTPLSALLFVLLCVVMIPMRTFAAVQNNLEDYGKPFVLLRRIPNPIRKGIA